LDVQLPSSLDNAVRDCLAVDDSAEDVDQDRLDLQKVNFHGWARAHEFTANGKLPMITIIAQPDEITLLVIDM